MCSNFYYMTISCNLVSALPPLSGLVPYCLSYNTLDSLLDYRVIKEYLFGNMSKPKYQIVF